MEVLLKGQIKADISVVEVDKRMELHGLTKQLSGKET